MPLFWPPNLKRLEAKRDIQGLVKALQYEKDPQVPCGAALALGRIGDAQAVEPLISTLQQHGNNWDVKQAAADALSQIGAPAVNALIAALADPISVVRVDAAEALGTIGDVRAVGALITALTDSAAHITASTDSAAHIFESAARALGQIGDAQAIEPLVAAYKHIRGLQWQDEATWRAIDLALAQFGARAVAPLVSALRDDDPFIRAHAADVLGRIGDQRATALLIPALQDQEGVVRKAAAAGLGELGWVPQGADNKAVYLVAGQQWDACFELGAPAVDSLIGALRDPQWDVRQSAAAVLVKIGEPAVEPLILALSGHGEYQPEEAADALGYIGDARAAEGLVAALTRTPPVFEALPALGRIGIPAAEPLLAALPHLASDLLRPATELLTTLGWQPDTSEAGAAYWVARHRWDKCIEIGSPAIEPLISTLKDPGLTARSADAAWALGEIGDAQAVEPLLTTLPSLTWDVREAAVSALVKCGWQPDRSGAGATYWLFSGNGSLAAIEECAKIGPPAVEPLMGALNGRVSYEVRATAARMLGEIGDPRAVEALIPVLDSHDASGGAAFNSLVKIGAPAVDLLIAELGERDSNARVQVARVLGEIGDPRAAEPLISALEEQDTRVPILSAGRRADTGLHIAAAEALWKIGDPRAVESLISALQDQDQAEDVRSAAAMALGKVGDARAVEPLERALQDQHLRWQAAQALDDIGARTGGAISVGDIGGRTGGPISVGDVVIQYRHYEFADPGSEGVELVDGPEPAFEDTSWRLRAIRATDGESAPPGLSYSGPGAVEPIVELELVKGSYKHARLDESELPEDPQERMMMRWEGKTVSEPGYILQLNNAPIYRDYYPDRDLLQQFYEEWKKAD